MPVFFNGRLWVSPVTASVVDDSRMYNRNLSVGNTLALLGYSEGGENDKVMRFGTPQEARALLQSGPLLTAIEKAFSPSNETGGPAEIVALRVNKAYPSYGAITGLVRPIVAGVFQPEATANLIDIQTTQYGTYTHQYRYKIESGTAVGKKITTQFGNEYFVGDNLARNSFSVRYTGSQATATCHNVDGRYFVVQAPINTNLIVVDLVNYPTFAQVVDYLNSFPNIQADLLDSRIGVLANTMDLDWQVDCKNADYIASADLHAAVDWINGTGEGFITATRAAVAGPGRVLSNCNWTYLKHKTGEVSATTASNQEWADAFTRLQQEDVQWVVPITPTAAIHAMCANHCTFMSDIMRLERRCIVGTDVNTTDDAAILLGQGYNNDRLSLTHLGFYDYGADGKLKLFEPYYLAAMLGGMFAGVNPGTALTNKSINVRGLERKLRNPVDTDRLISGGVLCVEDTKKGFKVVQSITTWMTNDNYNRVEVSTGVACDFVMRNWRNAVDDLRGSKSNPQLLILAAEKTDSILRELSRPEPMGPGVLVGNEENPPYRNIVVSIEGDVLRIECEASPVIPCNYILLVMHAVPWSGTITK